MPDPRQATVMVVDDEEMVLTALRTFLELETPYAVVEFTSPRDALVRLEESPVDAVVADFMMPEMDGVQFLKEVRASWPQTSRILLTGYADVQNAIRAINEAGLYYFLQKPWDNEHLKLVVRNGMERSTLVNELDARISALEGVNEELLEARRRLIRMFL
jgi:putative two-component system response regulator